MKKLTALLLCAMLSTVFTGCREEELSVEPITVIVAGENIVVTNNTSVAIYYFLLPAEAEAVIDWIPTVNEESPFIPPSSIIEIPFDEILFYEPSDKVAVFNYWIAVDLDGEIIPGNISSMRVALDK